ncbi:MAG: c-type cytochrome [Planctomycetales bacterium]
MVVFLGGANMARLQKSGRLETILTHAFADKPPKFRDLSWEADTAFRQGTVIERWRRGGFGDRDAQLKRVGATVLVAQFGRLESMAGKDGIETFAKALDQLIDDVEKQVRLVVLVTPTPFEKPPSPLIPDLSKHNDDLAIYVEAMKEIAAERGATLVDLFTNAKAGLTDNGMHIKPDAQEHVAQVIAKQLGVAVPSSTKLEPLRRAVVEKQRLWHDYWRPANWKLLYGDDARRQFTRGGKDYIPFKEEWNKLLPLIEQAEKRIELIAANQPDPGRNRPQPEVLHGDSGADVDKELASFTVPEGMQVNLFASDREGLTSPLAVRWDAAGRMYVTVTTTYPHVFPGDVPNDKIIVLEDVDADGKADKSSVFAEGLNIPTGLELGDGGVYVGQNTEILFLQDSNGDGKADQRRVLLDGFGNGDSHQTINTFVWSPGGELFFGQGDGIESRVETPWGASNLFQSGFYRLRPRRLQLHPLLDDFMGPGNPWGVAFDEWGQIFSIDGAGGVTFLSPGQVPSTHRLKLRTIGSPGGYCGIDYLDGRGLPESMQGDFVVGDFKANRIKRFSVKPDGAGFSLQWKEPLLQSKHRNFRPVDVKVGPDGAVYVVDWYNPITCHQDDAYRDPTRDKAHGRIWRVSSKGQSVKPPNLAKASVNSLLDALKAPEHWTRYHAKRALTQRDPATVADALRTWVRSLDPKDPRHEHHLYEALGTHATIESVEPRLLTRLLQAKDPRARAYAARIVGRWHDRLDHPLELLAPRVADSHPQVRMEAVLACAAIPSGQSMEIAARVVDLPMDQWIEYALTQTAHHLKPHWSPALQRGEISFAQPNHLAAVLNRAGGRDALQSLKKVAASESLDPESRKSVITAILSVGGPGELRDYGLDPKRFTAEGKYDPGFHADVLARLAGVARRREIRPSGDLDGPLNALIEQTHPQLKTHALALAGIWKVAGARDNVLEAAGNDSLPLPVRAAALTAIGDMKLSTSRDVLIASAAMSHPWAFRSAAIGALAVVDAGAAAGHAVDLFEDRELTTSDAAAILAAFLNRKGGAEALATALKSRNLEPKAAQRILRSLFSSGRSDQVLLAAINQAIGDAAKTPDYSQSLVRQLVGQATQQGDVARGQVLFNSLACGSCHQVSGHGGAVGPDLTSIGTTLSAERIAEELLWPNRQVKEGYSVIQVLTAEGKILQGYQRTTKDSKRSGDVVLQDVATGRLVVVKKNRIEEQRVTGSPMPTGLTALLSQSQLLDLIQYLSKLGIIQ